MRDEFGSCAPGSFTAVVLFYIYGAAAGPAVARCESHDSSAGNRDGPVILTPHRLHITPSCPPPQCSRLTPHHSARSCAHRHTRLHVRACMRACMRTHTLVLCLLRTLRPSVFQDPPSRLVHCCSYLILLICPRLSTSGSILRSELWSITLLEVLREQTVLIVLISPSTSAWRGRIQYMSLETLEQFCSAAH